MLSAKYYHYICFWGKERQHQKAGAQAQGLKPALAGDPESKALVSWPRRVLQPLEQQP